MEYKGNGWIILDKSLLTPEEYIVVLRILDRIDGSNLAETLIKAESTNFLGGPSLPQYYEKESKFITEEEMMTQTS